MFKRALILAFLFAVLAPTVASAQKLIFVVRHAERADAGMAAQTDPLLSAAGEARAAKLAAMLADAGIKAIFVTEFKRTQETATPLAAKLSLTPTSISSNDTAALLQQLRVQHADDVVLVVAHSNTIPDIVKAFTGADVKIADDEYDNLFVIVPGTKTLARIRFTP